MADTENPDKKWFINAIESQIVNLNRIGKEDSKAGKADPEEIKNKIAEHIRDGKLSLSQFFKEENGVGPQEALDKAVAEAHIRRAALYHTEMKGLKTDPKVADPIIVSSLNKAKVDMRTLYTDAANNEEAEAIYRQDKAKATVDYEKNKAEEKQMLADAFAHRQEVAKNTPLPAPSVGNTTQQNRGTQQPSINQNYPYSYNTVPYGYGGAPLGGNGLHIGPGGVDLSLGAGPFGPGILPNVPGGLHLHIGPGGVDIGSGFHGAPLRHGSGPFGHGRGGRFGF